MVGTSIGRYRILELLGRGGMGEVYAAEDTRLGRQVALKMVSRELALDAGGRERFEREARAIAALNHPNIVTIYSVEGRSTAFRRCRRAAGRCASSRTSTDGRR